MTSTMIPIVHRIGRCRKKPSSRRITPNTIIAASEGAGTQAARMPTLYPTAERPTIRLLPGPALSARLVRLPGWLVWSATLESSAAIRGEVVRGGFGASRGGTPDRASRACPPELDLGPACVAL